jgi:ParB family chromosome partitioning protein
MTVTPLHPADSQGGPVEPEVPVAAAPAIVLEQVDPRTLVLEANVRADARLDKAFVASVRDRGVLVPIVAHRDAGVLRVLYGQRRTLAAVEAGRTTVPVYVVDVPDGEKAREAGRIVDQLIENDHRTDLRDAERAAAFQQLSVLGLTASQIARRTHRKVATVRTGLAVSGSELATAALDRYDLTLEQAAVLAEFDSDPEAVKALTVVAVQDPGQFDHTTQRLRDRRATAAARDAAAAELESAGVPVAPEPQYGDRLVAKLSHLQAADGESELSAEEHAGCGGHAAFLRDRGAWGGTPDVAAVFVCTDWRKYGHQERLGSPITGMGSSGNGGKMSEEQKTERRVVVANNKAWDSARPVRRRWLTTFLARKSAPKDAPQWTAVTLANCSHEVRRALEDGHQTALQLLGLTSGDKATVRWGLYSPKPHPVAEAAAAASPARAGVLTLGLLLGGLESTVTRDAWRRPTAAHQAYFTALGDWGYPLSEVEQLVIQPTDDAGAEANENADADEAPADEAQDA